VLRFLVLSVWIKFFVLSTLLVQVFIFGIVKHGTRGIIKYGTMYKIRDLCYFLIVYDVDKRSMLRYLFIYYQAIYRKQKRNKTNRSIAPIFSKK